MKVCSIDDCDNKHYGQGYCNKHYLRIYRRGSVEPVRWGKTRICSVQGCTKPHRSLGFCQAHYTRFKRYGDATTSKQKPIRRGIELCKVDGCSDTYLAMGYCSAHYQRLYKNGTLESKQKVSPQTVGEVNWYKNNAGYVVGYLRGKLVAQHRIVWEQHHSCALHPFENIHHINGIRHDNRIENLELWTKAQPAGQRPEDLVKWVVENYPELVTKQMKGKGNGRSNSQTRTRVNGMAKTATSRRGR